MIDYFVCFIFTHKTVSTARESAVTQWINSLSPMQTFQEIRSKQVFKTKKAIKNCNILLLRFAFLTEAGKS